MCYIADMIDLFDYLDIWLSGYNFGRLNGYMLHGQWMETICHISLSDLCTSKILVRWDKNGFCSILCIFSAPKYDQITLFND